MAEKNLADTRKFAEMVAKKQAWVLNPDADFTASLIEGLTATWNRHGYYLCPCRDSDVSREADASVICPCRFSWKDIEEHGHCFCALYLSPAFAASGAVPGGIKDRRYST
jgi:ferredoxin-thioredoxin reductase catalytic subunit